jgi:hypothetical protein
MVQRNFLKSKTSNESTLVGFSVGRLDKTGYNLRLSRLAVGMTVPSTLASEWKMRLGVTIMYCV